jgi:hypothetical protein
MPRPLTAPRGASLVFAHATLTTHSFAFWEKSAGETPETEHELARTADRRQGKERMRGTSREY